MAPREAACRAPLDQGEITDLLRRFGQGDESALVELLPLVYRELHRIAERQMRRENRGHTLQTTALIHEAYLTVSKQKGISLVDRSHFFAVSALAMRQVLAGYARRKKALKRNRGIFAISLDEELLGKEHPTIDLIALDDALSRLEGESAIQVRIIELRYFSGLTVEETATVLKMSKRTVEREWRVARAWLFSQLS